MPSKAKFTTKVKQEIYERDGGCCVVCRSNNNLQFHHVLFGLDADRGPDRNKVNAGVTICSKHHLECHSCKSGEGIRQECIEYLNNLGE